jgi:hypothetical protein
MSPAVMDRAPRLFDTPRTGVTAPWKDGLGPARRDALAPSRERTAPTRRGGSAPVRERITPSRETVASPRTDPIAAPRREAPTPPASAKAVGVGGQARLEDVLSGIWEDLVAHRPAACLVCGSSMVPRYGASGPGPVGGRCTDCGSALG